MMVIWVLVFHTSITTFEGGQYQTRERCELAAANQITHWKNVYGERVYYRCHRLLSEDM